MATIKATIKSYTDLSQSKALALILPLGSADMVHIATANDDIGDTLYTAEYKSEIIINEGDTDYINCWSLAALLKYLSEIQPQVYTPILFPSEGKWVLQFTEYGHGTVCEVSCDNPVDACVDMILKLKRGNLL